MENKTIKIFSIRKNNSVVEWYKENHADGCFFDENCVKYNNREFFEFLRSLFIKWEKEGRPFMRRTYPNSLIVDEMAFICYIDEIEPGLDITNEVAGKFY